MNPVIVGLDPGRHESVPPLEGSRPSGGRLAKLIGLSTDDYSRWVDRVNLYARSLQYVPRTERDTCVDDHLASLNLLPLLRGRRVLLLGERVARAFGVDETPLLQWRSTRDMVYARIPHPSGMNRWWNDPDNVMDARSFLDGFERPCIHVEGADGSGKSRLARDLHDHLKLVLVDTVGPTRSPEDCMKRVYTRLAPGIVCDRSSGLVSELVYGPVLRGQTIVPESRLWAIAHSLRNTVTFVYCRPPLNVIADNHRPREGEDAAHVRAVGDKIDAIVYRYDEVMAVLKEMGVRVVEYDWTCSTDPLTEVMRCVAY